MSKIMLRSRGIVCFSQIQREIIGHIYPEVADKMQVIEPIDGPPHLDSPSPVREQGPLNVAVTGNFARQKGADIALLVMNYYKTSPDINFYVLGRIDPEYQIILARTGLKHASNIHIVGGYKPSQRYSIFDGMHVALFLSIWPEGYPLTLEDLKKTGVPCIASEMGVIGQQIEHGVNGWKVPPHDAGSVILILNSLIEDRSILDSVRAKFRSSSTSKPSYIQRIDLLFQEILAGRRVPATNRTMTIKQVKWLGGKIETYPPEAAIWANHGPIMTSQEQAPALVSPLVSPLLTPREAFRRFVSYARQRGIIGALRILAEYLTK